MKARQQQLMKAELKIDASPATTPHSRLVLKRQLASVSRWLHIYLSMLSFAILLFFAITGLTLNHAEYFSGKPRVIPSRGRVEIGWIKTDDAKVDRLAIVEHLRQTHAITGALSDFRLEESQVSVSFKGPGYAADVFLNRETGDYELTETRNGVIAALNDLHKGRDSGKAWSWLIDASAVLMTLVSLTGLVLIWFVKRRRLSGLILAGACAAACCVLYIFLVP